MFDYKLKTKKISVRSTEEEYNYLKNKSVEDGFSTVSEYLRYLIVKDMEKDKREEKENNNG